MQTASKVLDVVKFAKSFFKEFKGSINFSESKKTWLIDRHYIQSWDFIEWVLHAKNSSLELPIDVDNEKNQSGYLLLFRQTVFYCLKEAWR